MENEDITQTENTVETPQGAVGQNTLSIKQDRATRLRELAMEPDFSVPELKTTDMVFKEYTMNLTPGEIEDIAKKAWRPTTLGEQTSTAIENALYSMNRLPEDSIIPIGNVINYLTGSSIGEELQNIGYDNLDIIMNQMQVNEDSIGGVNSFWAKVAGGATTFTQLALEGLVSFGYAPLIHIGVQSYSQGTYNDMKQYADEHGGSLEGFQPETADMAINVANTLFQVGSEAFLGVGSPRFMRGWSRGFFKEAAGGFVQESLQSAVDDLSEFAKGNKEFEDMLNNADQYIIDGVIGAMLQGPLGAATYSKARAKSDAIIARAHAIAKGRKVPTKEDFDVAKKLNDAKERNYASVLNKEFKAAFDASTGEGQLQQNIVSALNKAVEAKELDLGVDNETDRAQKLEQIATQETLNAMEMAQEQGKAISEMELNNIVYRDGSIYLEGYNPEIGDMAVDRAKVIADRARIRAERQTGLAELNNKIDATNREIEQIKKDLAEAKAQSKQALAEKLQARLDKQTKIAEKRRLDAERLKKQTAKIETQIAKRLSKESAELAPAVKSTENLAEKQKTQKTAASSEQKPLAKVAEKLQKPTAEKKSLKEERATSDNALNQSKVEGTGSDKYRGGYDEKLKRIVLSDKSDLTTIQHEFAHYWMQNNFKWARSGLASEDWLRRWRGVEEALGIEPEDRFLSRQASEKFARAYEQYIMEGKYNEDLGWLFNDFQKFYQQVYEGLENDYFDLSEELDPKIVDWFNRQRPVTEQSLKEKAYQQVAQTAMAQGVDVAKEVNEDTFTVSSMDKNGNIETTVYVSDGATKNSRLVEYSGKKKERAMVKGLQQTNKDVKSDTYKAVNNAGTVENAVNWVENDYAGAWAALNDKSTALIDRTALYQAFKSYAENGHPEVAIDLAQVNLTKEMTEVGQAMSILSERAEFDPMNIIDLAQKALGQPSAEEVSTETADMHVDQAQNTLTAEQANEIKNQTECKL